MCLARSSNSNSELYRKLPPTTMYELFVQYHQMSFLYLKFPIIWYMVVYSHMHPLRKQEWRSLPRFLKGWSRSWEFLKPPATAERSVYK